MTNTATQTGESTGNTATQPHNFTRQEQVIASLCSASMRAITEEPDLYLTGLGVLAAERRYPIHAPHLQRHHDTADLTASRAISDSMALRIRHSDYQLHRSLAPESRIERLVFELLEQLRVEALADNDMPGLQTNLRQRFCHWSLDFHHSGLTQTTFGILFYTVAQICWAKINITNVLEETEDLIESTRFTIAADIGTDLAQLRRNIHDQAQFAKHALNIAKLITHNSAYNDDDITEQLAAAQDDEEQPKDGKQKPFGLLLEFDDSEISAAAEAHSGDSRAFAASQQQYRVFTDSFDFTKNIKELVRPALVPDYRQRLDTLWAQQNINATSMIRQLRALLATPWRDGQEFGQESGYLDGRKLSRIISSPNERHLYWEVQQRPRANTAITFLLDCSGSMKHHAESISLLIEMFCKVLERAHVLTEVLGYTTKTWNGGRAAKQWQKAGSPELPGRLNERLHMEIKSANQRLVTAKGNIACLLHTTGYRESIDGEGLLWAAERLNQLDVEQRYIVVLTDGSPMDAATHRCNDEFYLDNHLKQVISGLKPSNIGVMGLGVGLDLTPFYHHNRILDFDNQNLNQQFAEWFSVLREVVLHR